MKLVVPPFDFEPVSIGGSPDVRAPLPASPVAARVQALAALNGFTCFPAMYGARFPQNAKTATASVTPSTLEGAFIITAIAAPPLLNAATYEVSIRSGGRQLTEGRIRADLLFGTSRDQVLAWLPAPIVVYKGDSFYWEVSAPADLAITDGVLLMGYHIHDAFGGRLPPEVTMEFAEMVRNEGELYACGIVATVNADSENISYNTIIERMVMDSVVGGAGSVQQVQVWIADLNMHPLGLPWSIVGSLTADQRPVVMDDIRWPVDAGDRVVVHLTWADGTVQPMNVVVIGRRGPG